jgi:hypothetical protein
MSTMMKGYFMCRRYQLLTEKLNVAKKCMNNKYRKFIPANIG